MPLSKIILFKMVFLDAKPSLVSHHRISNYFNHNVSQKSRKVKYYNQIYC